MIIPFKRLRTAHWRALAGAGLIVAIHVAWLAVKFGGRWATTVFDDLLETVVPLAVAGVCWAASRRGPHAERGAWLLLGAACLSWGLGQAVWTVYEVWLRWSPFPSPADPLYLGMVPLGAAALLSFGDRGPGDAFGRLRMLFDGLIAWTSLLFVSWALVLGPLSQKS